MTSTRHWTPSQRSFTPRCCRCKARSPGSGRLDPPYNAVVTGSTKGIGLALARKHLDEGDNVVICSRSTEAVNAVVKELTDQYGSGRVAGRACNVSKGKDVASLIAMAQDEFGAIDLWINNAGTNAYSYKPLVEATENDLSTIIDTNVLGVMICCKAAINAMRQQETGGHVFIMDGAGADGGPTPRFAAYGATKRSLAQFAQSLQAELKQLKVRNIGIHNLSPGMVTTELLMSGADTAQAKFFINCLAETPDVVADYLVPKVRAVPNGFVVGREAPTGSYIKFLTPVKAYSNIARRLIAGQNKGRFVSED